MLMKNFPKLLIILTNQLTSLASFLLKVKLLGELIKMTVGGGQHDESLADDKTPSNPPPFSDHVDMSRIPAYALVHSAEDGSQPKWDDIKELINAGKMKEVNIWMDICTF